MQEAEELEIGPEYFVFKGTSYRADGGQTTFIWKVQLTESGSWRSESMAWHEGQWRPNPPMTFTRQNAAE